MSDGFLLGLDFGGSGARSVLLDLTTGEIAADSRAYAARGAPGTGGLGADLDLEALWSCIGSVSRSLLNRKGLQPEQIRGVACTSMRFGTIVLRDDGSPLLAVPNRDARAAAEGIQLAVEHGFALHERTGHWPVPVFAAPRLRWLAKNDPEAWARAQVVFSISDWMTWRACGERVSDPSQAAGTLLFDLEHREWAWDWIERLELPRSLFPRLVSSGQRVGSLTREAAATLGLAEGTPVAMGGADSQCALLGAAAVTPGQVAAVTGSTAPVQLVLDRPLVDAKARLWTEPHVVADRWVLESNAGPIGDSLVWLARILFADAEQPIVRLLADAAASEPGAAGLLSTVGGVVMNAREMRLPLGHLTLTHLTTTGDPDARRHVVRSVVEGLAFTLRANLEQLCEVGGIEPSTLTLAGGLSRNRTWNRIVGEAVGLPIEQSASAYTSGLGAALCAGMGAECFESLSEGAERFAQPRARLDPDPERRASYMELYASWTQLRAAHDQADRTASGLLTPHMLRAHQAPSDTGIERPRPRILVTADLDSASLDSLRALGEVEYASYREQMRLLSGPDLVQALDGFQIFVTEIDIVDVAALEKLPELRVVAACRGNAVNVDVEACNAFGIPVLSAPGRNAEAVADLTLAFILMLARKLPAASRFLRSPDVSAGDMGKMGQAFSTLRGRELGDKTVGLVGLGAVGRAVSKRLQAFGARVLVADPYLDTDVILRAGAEPVSIDELLERSDFVSLHATVTEQSKGLLGADEFARMKPGSFLINTARAALLDEDALLSALQDGPLAGAALDAFSMEPPGADHPLLALDNLIATPHVGGNTAEVSSHQGRIIAEALDTLLSGGHPTSILNSEALEPLDWHAPRAKPSRKKLRELSKRPAPAVSDLQKNERAAATGTRTTSPDPSSPGTPVSELGKHMQRLLDVFARGARDDARLRKFAADQDVTLLFTIPDLALQFHLRLHGGAVNAGLGAPEGEADVQLRMGAAILDGMFSGSLNAMESAMEGKIAFTGDTAKAMALQRMQRDLQRLYLSAREQVGEPVGLSDLGSEEETTASQKRAPAAEAGDVRHGLVATVNELYATQLITATGGNVSVRIPDQDQIWITPSQLFKGDLSPEVLVRLDLDGQSLDPGARSPSSEWSMHCAIYRARSNVRAVVHAHAPHATILANTGLPFVPISTEAAFFADLPRVPFIMPGTRELADAVAEAMADGWAVLMVNHGLLVAARSLRRAADMVEIIDRSAEVILGCHAVGREPPSLPEDVVETLRKIGDLVA